MSNGRLLAGRYELTRRLGRGGMAEVFAAHDRTLGREVAVKLLLERFHDDEAFTTRFHDEARHVARLNHPNLVAVYDTGTDQGQPYIVMELVEGRSLQQAIAAGGLTEDRALEVAADVCAALAYAHDRGLIHRDIKPGNILLADDGAVKVTDFGIARAVDNETVTRTASVLGTAAYLSPEQAQGFDVDARSDLYSLGVVLYEALTGQQPFNGDSAVTVAYQHVQEPPRPPREVDPGISPAAEAVTMRALAKNPANRYQHASEMRDDLANARVGSPVRAPAVLSPDETALLDPAPTGRQVRTHEQERRRRAVGYTLLTLVALLALVGGGFLLADLLAAEDAQRFAVPDVVDQPLDLARDLLTDRGFVVGDVDEDYSDDFAEGRVISQSPPADELEEEGTSVDLVVSLGPQVTEVPELVGRSEEDALRLIREADLTVGRSERVNDDEVEEGTVLSSDPPAGAEVEVGSRVSYTVSAGQEEVSVRPVVNRTEDEAVARLEDQELEVAIEREFSDVVAEGFVISQDPGAGAQVPVGSLVTIVVSQGPEEPEPEPCEYDPDLDADDPDCEPPEPEPEPCEYDPDLDADDPDCVPPDDEPNDGSDGSGGSGGNGSGGSGGDGGGGDGGDGSGGTGLGILPGT